MNKNIQGDFQICISVPLNYLEIILLVGNLLIEVHQEKLSELCNLCQNVIKAWSFSNLYG